MIFNIKGFNKWYRRDSKFRKLKRCTFNHFLNPNTVDILDDGLEVFISTNYSGNISSATWTKLDANLASGSSGGYASSYTDSGDIDLSSFSGKARIAFKYSGGDPSLTTTYQVDEIKILGN